MAYSVDAQVITDEGRQRWVQSTGERITEDGVTKLRGLVQDITNRKGREQRLNVLTRVLRHNLRNKMTVIIGAAEMLQEQLPAGGEHDPSKIVTNAKSLLSLAEKSKKFDEGMKYNYISGPVDVETILKELCAEYRESHPDATIETDLGDARAPGNEMAIRLIFDELLGNALKHNDRSNPTVSIIVASPGTNRVRISVVDNGPGVPEMEQQALQSGEETGLKHSNGIGSWTTNWLVSELRGDTQVTTTDGSGTTITVTIPGEKLE